MAVSLEIPPPWDESRIALQIQRKLLDRGEDSHCQQQNHTEKGGKNAMSLKALAKPPTGCTVRILQAAQSRHGAACKIPAVHPIGGAASRSQW